MYRFEKQQNFYDSRLSFNGLLYKHFIINLGINTNVSANLMLGYRHNYFSICAGYDAAISNKNSITAGSYEIMASFNLRPKADRKTVKDFEKW